MPRLSSARLFRGTMTAQRGSMMTPKKRLPDELEPCEVKVRLGNHRSRRTLLLRADVDAERAKQAKPMIWGAHPVDELVKGYLDALRAGIPKLPPPDDPTGAQIVSISKSKQSSGTRVDMELALPAMTRAHLQPLVALLHTSSVANGVTGVEIEEVGAKEVETSNQTWKPRKARPKIPFTFDENVCGELKKYATLHLIFDAELSANVLADLERWMRAWSWLVGSGAFLVPTGHRGSWSHASLEEIVDPYPTEWVASFTMLMVSEEAVMMLVERLADLHTSHPIAKAEFS